ncbi:hypothetical protein [Escherichia coli]|uniref:hypothetical protein n=1 Tax=Escherichia coli TaxID=562 RepID=UPI001FCEB9D9|nr:hypothetical protein [Escherichia coli]
MNNYFLEALREEAAKKYPGKCGKGISHQTLGAKLRLDPADVRAVFNGDKKPKLGVIHELAKELKLEALAVRWLYSNGEVTEEVEAQNAELKLMLEEANARIAELEAKLANVQSGANKHLPPVKQQKHKADDLLEWLKEHNGFDGDATALAKAWKPDDAPGRTTTVLLLKQLKDAGHIEIVRHGPKGTEIKLKMA